jgi:hypothetical protein
MNTFLTRANKDANPIKTIYLPFSIADPCVFQGLLLLSARSYAKASGDDSFHVTALACKAECFRLVNIALEDPRKATSDATIATVLMLAVDEVCYQEGRGSRHFDTNKSFFHEAGDGGYGRFQISSTRSQIDDISQGWLARPRPQWDIGAAGFEVCFTKQQESDQVSPF